MLFLAVLPALFSLVFGECRQSFMTICDSFPDFEKYKGTETLSELMIGSSHGPSNMTSVNLMNVLQVPNYHKLTMIIVTRAINQLEKTYGYQCTYDTSPVKYMYFYGNEMKNIEPYHFPLIPLKKLSLVNNKIESVADWSFKFYEIENLDLSDNLLDVVVSGSLPSTNVTKIITIRNNQLTHVEPNSFPNKLESLNLDKNKLRYLQDDALANLNNLKELTISHNKFNTLPKISHLKELVIFDISFNAISTIPKETFSDMEKLKFLDLSNNNIDSIFILQWLYTPSKQPTLTISLALNRLRGMNLDDVSLENKTLVLYGNPWDCNTWPDLKKQLQGHESECDLQFLSEGTVPVCINYRSGGYAFTSLWDNDVDRFHKAVRKSEKNSKCNLVPVKYHHLYPVSYGCVA